MEAGGLIPAVIVVSEKWGTSWTGCTPQPHKENKNLFFLFVCCCCFYYFIFKSTVQTRRHKWDNAMFSGQREEVRVPKTNKQQQKEKKLLAYCRNKKEKEDSDKNHNY